MAELCIFERNQDNSFWTGGDGLQMLRVTAKVQEVTDIQVIGYKGESCKVFYFEFCLSDFTATNYEVMFEICRAI